MRDNIKLIIKGFIIGLGKILPGVSGAVLAMMLNVYEPTLKVISNLKNNLYYNLKFLMLLGLGGMISIVFGSNLLLFFLDKFYIQTMFLFIGIIIGGIKGIVRETQGVKFKEILIAVIIVTIFCLLSFLPTDIYYNSSNNIFICFISGILDAFASIVPGVSGTILLTLIGTYKPILKAFAGILDFNLLSNNLLILFPFFIGFLFGAYFISKFLNYAFKRYRTISYSCIVGFIIISILMLIIKMDIFNFSFLQILISCLFGIIGLFISKKINI